MIPSPGRIVEYTLSDHDANLITERRKEHAGNYSLSAGNFVQAGQTYPLVITRVWAEPGTAAEHTAVNGQLLLDGNDTHWVTSTTQGDGPCHWREFPRV